MDFFLGRDPFDVLGGEYILKRQARRLDKRIQDDFEIDARGARMREWHNGLPWSCGRKEGNQGRPAESRMLQDQAAGFQAEKTEVPRAPWKNPQGRKEKSLRADRRNVRPKVWSPATDIAQKTYRRAGRKEVPF